MKKLLWILYWVAPACMVVFFLIHIIFYDVGNAPKWIKIAEWTSLSVTVLQVMIVHVVAILGDEIKVGFRKLVIFKEPTENQTCPHCGEDELGFDEGKLRCLCCKKFV